MYMYMLMFIATIIQYVPCRHCTHNMFSSRTAVPLPLRSRQPFLWFVSSWGQRPTQISWRPLISLSLVLNSVWLWPWWEFVVCCIWSGPESRVSKKLSCRLTNDSTSTLRGETKGNSTICEDKINFYTCS